MYIAVIADNVADRKQLERLWGAPIPLFAAKRARCISKPLGIQGVSCVRP